MCQITMMKSLAVVIFLALFASNEAIVRVLNEWPNGFTGLFSVSVATATTGSWRVRLHFSKTVSHFKVWDANVDDTLDNGATYILSNKHWNGDIGAGRKIEMQFIANKVGRSPTATAELITDDIISSTPSGPTTTEPTINARCTFKVIEDWPGQFKGKLGINVKNNYPNGWTVVLIFSKPVYDLQTMTEGTVCDVTTTTLSTTVSATSSASTTLSTTSSASSTTASQTTTSSNAAYNYGEVLRQSILFYEAQRSGKLPADNRVPWRKDSALGDKGDNGEDLTGGWYDAGDHVKFGFPMAASATNLVWGLLEFEKGYKASGQFDWAVKGVKWALDYFIKCHVADEVFYGQVGDGHVDHSYWGRPEDMTMNRPAFKINASKPGSDLAGETAAAMAAGSLLFKNIDPAYSTQLLDHAKSLYAFAYSKRGLYQVAIPNAASFYSSSAYTDELCWGALWLYKVTSDNKYLEKAKEFLPTATPWAFSWDDKQAGSLVLLQELGVNDTKHYLETFLTNWFRNGTVPYTPGGLAWRDKWGSLRYSANAALVALVAAKHGVMTSKGRAFATNQIGYMLGDNGRSFVVGYGVNPPQRPHHASSSCPDAPAACNWSTYNSPAPNAHVLHGALVGGPGLDDAYQDVRSDYVQNEVADDYNAGFQGALAGLKEIHG